MGRILVHTFRGCQYIFYMPNARTHMSRCTLVLSPGLILTRCFANTVVGSVSVEPRQMALTGHMQNRITYLSSGWGSSWPLTSNVQVSVTVPQSDPPLENALMQSSGRSGSSLPTAGTVTMASSSNERAADNTRSGERSILLRAPGVALKRNQQSPSQ